jgi:methionine-rich copper-binding protein CopC
MYDGRAHEEDQLELVLMKMNHPSNRTPFLSVSSALAALALFLGGGGPADGHPIVLGSSVIHDSVLARAPEEVTLRFNSRIEPQLTRVTITKDDGRPVPLSLPVTVVGATSHQALGRLVIPLRPLARGTYVIRYKVLAADGHVTEGALRFTVSPPE